MTFLCKQKKQLFAFANLATANAIRQFSIISKWPTVTNVVIISQFGVICRYKHNVLFLLYVFETRLKYMSLWVCDYLKTRRLYYDTPPFTFAHNWLSTWHKNVISLTGNLFNFELAHLSIFKHFSLKGKINSAHVLGTMFNQFKMKMDLSFGYL